ncbi:hypothetical protein KJ819_00660 [Patescibacteria group bacterium]|nr:hypothetical protein [Patescibacteria group bacterium]MBU1500642.1 hypothetical protein [Patescibacteria group bacterium]
MNANSSLSDTILSRVRTVHTVRRATPVVLASFVFLVASLWALGREVWVSQVFANMPPFFDVPALASFMTYAFLHTDIAVQILCLALVVATIGLARGCARILATLTNSYV